MSWRISGKTAYLPTRGQAAAGTHKAPHRVEPPVEELLGMDREYRRRARAGSLPRIAPEMCNPMHEAWLPVMHSQLGDRRYTVAYSNSAEAHRYGKTRDWVVIRSEGPEGAHRYTVVTAGRGWLRGKRMVRPRENESTAYHLSRLRAAHAGRH